MDITRLRYKSEEKKTEDKKHKVPKKPRKSLFVSVDEYPEKVPLKYGRKIIPNYFITRNGIVLKVNKYGTEMKVLSLSTRKDGYTVVGINGKVVLLHCLLVESFIADLSPRYFVKHQDGDRSNNAFSNLACYEADTKQEASE